MNRNITTPRISGEAWGEIALIKCLCRCDMFQRLGPESLPGKISKDKFPALRACSRLFATAILATSGNNAFSPLNLTYFTPTQHRGKSKTVRINRWAKWFLLESFYSSLWQILEGSQEERPEFNKGLSENVPRQTAQEDRKVVPADHKKWKTIMQKNKTESGAMRCVLQGEKCKDNRNCIGFGAKSWIGWHQRGLRVVAVKLLMKEQTPSSWVGVHLLQSLKKSQVELIKRSRDILDSGISRHFSSSTSSSSYISNQFDYFHGTG